MEIKDRIVSFSVRHYKVVTWVMVIFTLACAAFIPLIQVDTDPENMLSEDEPVRVFHDEMKEAFTLNDIVVVGVIDEEHEYGVFNPETLGRVYELTQFAKDELQWEEGGVMDADVIAPSEVDHIGQGGPGEVTFEWLMPQPPQTQEEALAIRDKALSNPLLADTMVSEDGRALAIYLPLTSKDLSYRVYTELNKKIAEMGGGEDWHITGLPVAEDTFGVEMFIQMAISAPLAMVTIFILMLLFFRKLVLVISPMIIAMVAVLSTMGLLIGLGYPVHIMSSMIPIFLMPIAVVDSVHILSEFFDRYTKEKGRKASVVEVMHTLFVPMLYTSLTSAAGFASLALTPIPPVQVFGIFVAVGIMIAWLFTILFVPAYVMMIPEKSLANFGLAVHQEEQDTWMTRVLQRVGVMTWRHAKPIVAVLVVVSVVAIYGITQIRINDNPVKWFAKSHPIRQADEALNAHFGGTYMAYLVLEGEEPETLTDEAAEAIARRFDVFVEQTKEREPALEAIAPAAKAKMGEVLAAVSNPREAFETMSGFAESKLDAAGDDEFYAWQEISTFFGVEGERLRVFKRPEVLRWVYDLQEHVEALGLAGKSNSVANVVMKVNQELIDGDIANYRVPESLPGVAETLIQFQQSHDPQDLWHLVTPDFMTANVWMQLTSGDNKDMELVVKAVDAYLADNPPPAALEHQWAGLTYINIVWQNKMVSGMLQSFLGSFLIVFIMMSVLFRSPLWGLLCMVPLTITIVVIYGVIGLVGKDYDMPVAVLSALTLGMAVDFAIHFLQRARELHARGGSWEQTAAEMFGEPARAITRNVLVIAIGFLPLLAAPLMPYKTVGIFLCAIMALSGIVTLLALPAFLQLGQRWLFKAKRQPVGFKTELKEIQS